MFLPDMKWQQDETKMEDFQMYVDAIRTAQTFTPSSTVLTPRPQKRKSTPGSHFRHICEVCPKEFNDKTTLERHKRTHTGEKPYLCTYLNCGKAFADATNLKRHEGTHLGLRDYKCPVDKCTFVFSRGAPLKQHMVSIHRFGFHDPIVLNAIRKNRHQLVNIEEPSTISSAIQRALDRLSKEKKSASTSKVVEETSITSGKTK